MALWSLWKHSRVSLCFIYFPIEDENLSGDVVTRCFPPTERCLRQTRLGTANGITMAAIYPGMQALHPHHRLWKDKTPCFLNIQVRGYLPLTPKCKGDSCFLRHLDKLQTQMYKPTSFHTVMFSKSHSAPSWTNLLNADSERWFCFFTCSLHRERDSISYKLISSHSTNS